MSNVIIATANVHVLLLFQPAIFDGYGNWIWLCYICYGHKVPQ